MTAALKADVLDANRSFYEYFRNGDIARMEKLWARYEQVSVIHPGWSSIRGRDDVMASWRQVMIHSIPPEIFPTEVCVILSGERKATAFCVEQIGDAKIFASNIFTYEDDAWRIMHHQATPLPLDVG